MGRNKFYKKISLLKSGQIVRIGSNFFRARSFSRLDCDPCDVCQLDSICHGPVAYVCKELDYFSKKLWYLELASINNNKK